MMYDFFLLINNFTQLFWHFNLDLILVESRSRQLLLAIRRYDVRVVVTIGFRPQYHGYKRHSTNCKFFQQRSKLMCLICSRADANSNPDVIFLT